MHIFVDFSVGFIETDLKTDRIYIKICYKWLRQIECSWNNFFVSSKKDQCFTACLMSYGSSGWVNFIR
jgi:hypothetical protein